MTYRDDCIECGALLVDCECEVDDPKPVAERGKGVLNRDWADLRNAVRKLSQDQAYAIAASGDRVLLGWSLDTQDGEEDQQERWHLHGFLGVCAALYIDGDRCRWSIDIDHTPVESLKSTKGVCVAEHATAMRAGIVALLVGDGMVDCSRRGRFPWGRA